MTSQAGSPESMIHLVKVNQGGGVGGLLLCNRKWRWSWFLVTLNSDIMIRFLPLSVCVSECVCVSEVQTVCLYLPFPKFTSLQFVFLSFLSPYWLSAQVT